MSSRDFVAAWLAALLPLLPAVALGQTTAPAAQPAPAKEAAAYRTSDWAYDNATPVSSNNVLLTGQSSPNYPANVVGFSVSYTGW